jgi:phosphoribosylaminoimidazole-succinocarboxamide synthase
MREARDRTLEIYKRADEYAATKGIIIADTKMEFGLLGDKLILIDELLTPDSSRFWPKDKYRPGGAQESFDKQYVRDYLVSIGFNKRPPGPVLPPEVVAKTSELYRRALVTLTGRDLEE